MNFKRKPHQCFSRFYNHLDERKPSSWIKRIFTLARETKFIYHGLKQYKKHGISNPSSLIDDNTKEGIWWIGHATFLIKLGGTVIMTDPVFNSLPFVNRLVAPAIKIDDVPHVDVVLISHNHWDHFSLQSLKLLHARNNNILICVPQGDGRHLKKYKFNFLEWEWWQTKIVNSLKFNFLPAKHWSQSGLLDRNKSLWGSWLVEGPQNIYFAGDSSYDTHFKEISYHYKIDQALLPIGPCEPREVMCHSHMSPEEALTAFFDLQAETMIPMHWGTFSFGLDEKYSAIERLNIASESNNVLGVKVLEIGEGIEL